MKIKILGHLDNPLAINLSITAKYKINGTETKSIILPNSSKDFTINHKFYIKIEGRVMMLTQGSFILLCFNRNWHWSPVTEKIKNHDIVSIPMTSDEINSTLFSTFLFMGEKIFLLFNSRTRNRKKFFLLSSQIW